MFAERFQAAVQQGLAESAAARALCAQLAGRSLRVIVSHTPITATIRSDGRTLNLETTAQGASGAATSADATITGSALGLLGLARADRRDLVQRGVVEVSGETEIAEQFARLLALLRPDSEQLLASALGRAPAHALVAGARQAWSHGAELFGNFAATATDYFAHERRELLTSAEAQLFYRQLDELRARVASLEARLAKRQAGIRQ